MKLSEYPPIGPDDKCEDCTLFYISEDDLGCGVACKNDNYKSNKHYLIPAAVADAVVAVIDALDEVTFFGTCIGKSDCRFDEKCTDGESECEYYKLKQARDKYREVSKDETD